MQNQRQAELGLEATFSVQLKRLTDLLRNSLLARNTFWMMAGHGLRLLVQATYFVLIARALGAEGLGAFMGVVALVNIASPFAGLGIGNLLIKNVSRNAGLFACCWGNALLVTFASASLLFVLVLVFWYFVLAVSVPGSLVLVVAVSDLFFGRLVDVSGQAYMAFQRLNRTAQLQVMLSSLRFAAALVFLTLSPGHRPVDWSLYYLGGTAVSALIAATLVSYELGSPKLALERIRPEMKEGFYFATGLSAQGIYNDIDKTMLVRLSTLGAAGIYAAAYRLIDVAFLPVRSLLWAAYARFFQHGVAGLQGTLGFAKRLLPLAGGYGLAVGAGLFIAAPLVPLVLGADYGETVEAVRWLALLPFLKAVHDFAADSLTGAGFQGQRSCVQVLVAVANVGLNFWLIPIYSWRGAAWASLLSDGWLAAALWVSAWWLARRTQGQPAGNPPPGVNT